MKILNKKEAAEIASKINEIYDSNINFDNFVVLLTGRENKIWLASRKIFEIKLENLKINSIGLYFGREDRGKFRLSVEGAQMIGKTAKKNICEIEDVWNFLRGFDVKPTKEVNCNENEYVLVKYKEDILGIAKLQDGMLKSVLPKARKITSLTKYEN
jgi:NOL1/NOP2/fmu family ribosome biogenesis protein